MNDIKEQDYSDVLADNLRLLINRRGINDAELSRRTNIPQATLHKLLSRKTLNPRVSTLNTLAEYLDVSLDELYTNNLSQQKLPKVAGTPVPVISWEACLTFPSEQNYQNWIVIDFEDSEHMFGLVSRPSMERRFPRGTTFVVDSKTKPTDGNLVIVHYPGTKEATLRELSIDGPHQLLVSLNPDAPASHLDETITIIGTVIQSRFTYQI